MMQLLYNHLYLTKLNDVAIRITGCCNSIDLLLILKAAHSSTFLLTIALSTISLNFSSTLCDSVSIFEI